MSLFGNLFGKQAPLIDCPRCLGKGDVDWEDIKRLKQELRWVPGPCAYCNGSGKVVEGQSDRVPVDTTYLVHSLPEDEKDRLMEGDPDAWDRALQSREDRDNFIRQICYLYQAHLEPEQIATFFLIGTESSPLYETQKHEMMEYVERVIGKKNNY